MARGNPWTGVDRGQLLLAGLHTGILGGAAMLALLSVAAMWNGRSFWSTANILAATFYGEEALYRGFRWSTLTGLALHFSVCGVLGMAFSLAAAGLLHDIRVRLLGLLFALAWYWIWFGYLWSRVNPLVPLYMPPDITVAAHLLLGVTLGFLPRWVRSS